MRYRRDYIIIYGKIWLPPIPAFLEANITGAFNKAPTREELQDYIDSHSGDFQEVYDFYAHINTTTYPWTTEEAKNHYERIFGEEE